MTHQLTLAEKQQILTVLQKEEKLQMVEEERERDLLNEFSRVMSVLAQSVCDRVHSQNITPTRHSFHICATVCRAKPHFIRCNGEKTARSNSCWDCNQITCRSCGIVQAVPAQKKNVWLCKPCSYRRELISKSGEWYYGKDGLHVSKMINQQIIEALEVEPEEEDLEEDTPSAWKMKAKFAQKRLSQTGQTTLKVMKQKWQTLAKIKAHFAETHQYSFGSDTDEESNERVPGERKRSTTCHEEIELYKEYRATSNRKKHTVTPMTYRMSRKQAFNGSFSSCSRDSSPERYLSSQTSGSFSQTSLSSASSTNRTHSYDPNFSNLSVDINELIKRDEKLSKGKRISAQEVGLLKSKHSISASSCTNLSTKSLVNISNMNNPANALSAKRMKSSSTPKLYDVRQDNNVRML